MHFQCSKVDFKIKDKKVMSNKNPFIINKYCVFSALLLLIKQLIVATSTLWIVKMGQNLNDPHAFILYFCLFASSLIVVYIPGSLSRYFLDLSVFKSFQRYIERFNNNHYGNAALSRDSAYKKQHEPYLVNEGMSVINELHSFYSNYLEIAVNIILSIFTLSYLIDENLLIAYAISIILVTSIILLFSPKIKQASSKAQSSRVNLVQVLTQQWDNVLIGNQRNYSIWHKHFKTLLNNSKETKVKNTLWVEFSTTIASLIGFIPIIYFLLETITEAANDIALLTALIATLPRQITTVHYLSDIAFFSNEYTALKARIKGLRKSLILKPMTLKANISWDNISIYNTVTEIKLNKGRLSLPESKSLLNAQSNGRYRLSGPNGCGKSSLLLLLKEHYREDAYYLPAHSDLFFESAVGITLSSGEKQIHALNDIKEIKDVNLLLLDEWDANLDNKNKQLLSKLLDTLSASCCILEVRHNR